MPVGRPMRGTEAYVVDAALRPLPVGVVGEVVLLLEDEDVESPPLVQATVKARTKAPRTVWARVIEPSPGRCWPVQAGRSRSR